jgi:hypothetical protein
MFERAGYRGDSVAAGSVAAAVDCGYVAPLEPGAVDPARFREFAAARAARAGVAPVADPASGKLEARQIGVGFEVEEFAADCLAGCLAGWGGDGATMPDGPWDAPDWDGRPPVELPPDVMGPPVDNGRRSAKNRAKRALEAAVGDG